MPVRAFPGEAGAGRLRTEGLLARAPPQMPTATHGEAFFLFFGPAVEHQGVTYSGLMTIATNDTVAAETSSSPAAVRAVYAAYGQATTSPRLVNAGRFGINPRVSVLTQTTGPNHFARLSPGYH